MYTLLSALATAAPDAASPMQVQSVWDFLIKGGWMMVPIGLCSLIALAVISERLISLSRSRVIPPKFLGGLKKVLKDHPDDRARALSYCRKNGSPVANVFAAGIKRLGAAREVLEKYIEEAGHREMISPLSCKRLSIKIPIKKLIF